MSDQKYVELVSRLKTGKEDAFNTLYYEFFRQIHYFAEKIIGDHGAAEEIASDTFYKLHKLRKQFDKIEQIKSFLYITARNASLNHLRNKKRKPGLDFECLIDELVENTAVTSEVLAVVEDAIEKLPAKCKAVFKAIHIEGMTYTDVARELKITESTARTQKQRALKLIREAIRDAGNTAILILWMFITLICAIPYIFLKPLVNE